MGWGGGGVKPEARSAWEGEGGGGLGGNSLVVMLKLWETSRSVSLTPASLPALSESDDVAQGS